MTTQQTKWGPEIKVDGKRPEWLSDDEAPEWKAYGDIWRTATVCRFFHWPKMEAIRLRADHPYYAQPEAPTPSPELTARMTHEEAVAWANEHTRPIKRFTTNKGRGRHIAGMIYALEKLGLAEPKPVDGDRNEAERIAYDMEGALPRDLVEAGIKRGRKMEADERNAAIKRKWDDAHGSGAIAGRALAEAGK